MTNADIKELSSELQIDDWEFSRNHWAIKDVDLFQVLYRQKAAQRPMPIVFQLSEQPVSPKLISMMMPFSAAFAGPISPSKLRLRRGLQVQARR